MESWPRNSSACSQTETECHCSGRGKKPLASASFVPATDRKTLTDAIRHAFCAVTATGKRHAMSGLIEPAMPFSSGVLLANMGVEDEWGPEIPKTAC